MFDEVFTALGLGAHGFKKPKYGERLVIKAAELPEGIKPPHGALFISKTGKRSIIGDTKPRLTAKQQKRRKKAKAAKAARKAQRV